MYTKLTKQMKDDRYYPALKTLEQLEHTYLPRVKGYRFSQIMTENIPKLRDSIKEASMSEFVDFLENIREHSDRIGQVAMKQGQKQSSIEDRVTKQGKETSIKKNRPGTNSPPESESHGNPFDDDDDDEFQEDEDPDEEEEE
uniref:Exocyst complex component 6B-like n=1 Tax=Saccoglossus kowalevskii TaxID=10224 RepID=A0ABM0MR89_SACKO